MLGRAGRLAWLVAATVSVAGTSGTAVLFTRSDPGVATVVASGGISPTSTNESPTTTTEPPTTTTEPAEAPAEEPASAPTSSGSGSAPPSGATTPTTQAPPPPPPPPPNPAPANLAGQILSLINQSRASAGLAPLSWNGQLAGLASDWANYLGTQVGTLVHRDLNSVINSPAYAGWSTLGENLYLGPSNATAADIHGALMNSPPHRANILSPNFTLGGVGLYVNGQGQLFVTENFGATF